MAREYILKFACGFLFVGLAAGLIGQIELMSPGTLFLSEAAWLPILKLHVWATSISLCVICAFTVPLLRHKITALYWIVWGASAVLPLSNGLVIQLMLSNAGADAYLNDTVYVTANRHAYGIVGLCFALGGLSAWQKMKGKSVPLKFTIPIAILVTLSALMLIITQAALGLNGMPSRYIDYPQEFAQSQFFVSLAAIICLSLAGLYLGLLWGRPDERAANLNDVF